MDSPLLNADGAVPAEGPDQGVAAHYGDPYAEQRALDLAAGLVDRSNRGVLRITGPDRLSWLHSLTTQHLEQLGPGGAAEALVLSPQGHIEHHLTLTDDGTATWLHVEPGTAASLLAFLESMRFMLRVEAADVSGEYAYRGQETVARVHNLGHPPRRLVFLHLDGSEDRLPGHNDPVELAGATVGFVGSAARHYVLGPIGLALIKRTTPVDATLLAGGVPAAQEVVVPPDAGGNVKVTLKRRPGLLR
jgi:folate-binding Fe-S cluster repair protein YgfZ